jgi:hypothetical protein
MTHKIEPFCVTIAPDWLTGDQQTLAMLQAQNSRTLESIENRTAGAIENPGKLMSSLEKWYLNYNHRSIGQCGSATVFLEGVSLGVAPILQSSPLYVGQECSTRYIDFGDRGFALWAKEADYEWEAEAKQMDKYREILDKAMTYFGGMSDNKAAIKARAFDFARMALPLSCATNLSITLNFDEWDKHLNYLYSQDYEAKNIAIQIRYRLHEAYPHVMSKDFTGVINPKFEIPEQETTVCGMLEEYPFPYFQTGFTTDYGAFRDIQRHRPLNPVLRSYGYTHFFVENADLFEKVTGGKYDFDSDVYTLGSDAYVEISGLSPYLKYFVDMRFRETVHPTVSVAVVDIIQNLVGDGGMNVYTDLIDSLGLEGSNFDAAIVHLSEKHPDIGWEDLKKHCLNSLISMPSAKRAKAEGVAQ